MKRLTFTVVCILALLMVPAQAHHKEGHENGPDRTHGSASSDSDVDSSDNDNRPTHGCEQAQEADGDPYDSTCDGSPSGNGNGEGEAGGKPCAGCVGAADNKNPPGQMPNGSDSNNGYECDGNEGVGKTNPAHTGCSTASPTPTPTPTTCTPGSSGCPTPEPTPTDTPTCIVGSSECDDTDLDIGRHERGDDVQGSTLPHTGLVGSVVKWLLGIAGLLILIGIALGIYAGVKASKASRD